MLENKIVFKIRELLKRGDLSQRKIAKLFGVSNTTVSLIYQKRRKPYAPSVADLIKEPSGPFVRCPICGGLSKMPCVYCQVNAYLREHGFSRGTAEVTEGELKIELTEEHRKRYEEVHDWRASSPDPYFIDIPEDWPWRKSFRKREDRQSGKKERRSAKSGQADAKSRPKR